MDIGLQFYLAYLHSAVADLEGGGLSRPRPLPLELQTATYSKIWSFAVKHGTVLKIIKMIATSGSFRYIDSFSTGALTRAPFEELRNLQHSPRPSGWFKGSCC